MESLYAPTSISAFRFAPVSSYEVTDWVCDNSALVESSVSRSSLSRLEMTKPTVSKLQRAKKQWKDSERIVAVLKAREMGLTKATHFLKENYPAVFSKLSASTLQYWLKMANKI
ncbi:hypothetical protein EIN_281950 [Entamoeba invadens IP1]|uniref:Uncharacterized protein n=1 Tax=Entamoeba invadens IP1 TaxID=370355 RepID=A0A0A1U2Q3_ENTIV|nr:hypothetical protein EIN_281950 [Entamoeba invadens IP1]ELP85824.1 hypothetical protein EIN_281950 [Entamoeba invadens IP1]|eukprot:XP_004185170.1 hypothetical protein EIN_281950 [Entamoeba invadens IP1]